MRSFGWWFRRLLLPQSRFHLLLLLLLLLAALLGGVQLWARYHFQAAAAAIRQQDYVRAQHHIQNCLFVWPTSVASHRLAARIERLSGRFDRAEQYLKECKRLEKEVSSNTQVEWLLLRAEQGEIDKVSGVLWAWIEAEKQGRKEGKGPDQQDTLAILETMARLYLQMSRYLMALPPLNRWLEEEPGCVQALDWRGFAREQINQTEPAIEDYLQALQREPGRDPVRQRLCQLLITNRRATEALTHADYLREHSPDNPRALVLLAAVRMEFGEYAEARQLLNRNLESYPDHVESLLFRGHVDLLEGQPTEAEPWLRKAAAQNPCNPRIAELLYQSLAQQPNRSREADAALARFKSMRNDNLRLTALLTNQIDRTPPRPDLNVEVAKLLLNLGQENNGRNWLFAALRLDPNYEPAHRLLFEYYEKHNQPEEAAKHRRYLKQPAESRKPQFTQEEKNAGNEK